MEASWKTRHQGPSLPPRNSLMTSLFSQIHDPPTASPPLLGMSATTLPSVYDI
jgi:hypothetical protein